MNKLFNIRTRLVNRYQCPGGYGEVLKLAIPLILCTASWSIQHFVDRMFLTWYSPEAIAAAFPAGMLNFTITCIFIGVAGFATTFVAQLYGRGDYREMGKYVWQGVYVGIIGGVVMLLLIPFASATFAMFGHERIVIELEVDYFQYLCLGCGFAIISAALSGFFSGIGKVWPVMWVNVLATLVNVVLDYAMIFGRLGFPEMGIKGAGLATSISALFAMVIFFILLDSAKYREKYRPFAHCGFNKKHFLKLIRFGVPAGLQFFLDMAAFTVFIMFVGRLGTEALAATNITFNLNSLAFMPMLGFGTAISIVVGHSLGREDVAVASRGVYSGFQLTLSYMAVFACIYLFAPALLLSPYAAYADPAKFNSVKNTVTVLLKFVAFYSLFDTMNIIFISALKGAGDTKFIMWATFIVSFCVLIVPTWFALYVFDAGIYVVWVIATLYICTFALVFYFRFRQGKWKTMRVIEPQIVQI